MAKRYTYYITNFSFWCIYIFSMTQEPTPKIPQAPPLSAMQTFVTRKVKETAAQIATRRALIEKAKQQKRAPQSQKPLKLIMFLDYTDETLYHLGPFTTELAIAIYQKTAPIIVSPNLLYNFLFLKQRGKTQELMAFVEKPYTEVHLHVLEHFYAFVPFENADWAVFKHTQKNLYLLCPRTYLPVLAGTFNSLTAELPLDTLLAALEQTKSQWELDPSTIEEANDPKHAEKFPWNIETVKELFKEKSGPWHIYLAFHGAPSGTPEATFLQSRLTNFMTFLNTKITTEFLFYASCYGGGQNLELVKQSLEQLAKPNKPTFITAVGALTDAIMQGVAITPALFSKTEATLNFNPPLSFTAFFDKLNTFFNRGSLKTLQETLQAVTFTKFADTYNTPTIIFPGNVRFNALLVDKETTLINNVFVKVHEIEKKEIIVRDKTAILLAAPAVTVPLKIVSTQQVVPSFISILPGNAVHTLDTITASSFSLAALLQSFFSKIVAKKEFIIQTVSCTNYLGSGLDTIENQQQENPLILHNVHIVTKYSQISKKQTRFILASFDNQLFSSSITENEPQTISFSPEKNALWSAVQLGNKEAIAALLKQGITLSKNEINATDAQGNTLLHYIAAEDQKENIPVDQELIHLLLQKGADLSIRDTKGEWPLAIAIETAFILNDTRMVASLVQGLSPQEVNEYGDAYLYGVLRKTEKKKQIPLAIEIINLLRQQGVNISKSLIEAVTRIFMFSNINDTRIAVVLLEEASPQDVNTTGLQKNTSLHFVTMFASDKNMPIIKEFIPLLMRHGADPSIKNNDGKTPLDLLQEQRLSKQNKAELTALLSPQPINKPHLKPPLPAKPITAPQSTKQK